MAADIKRRSELVKRVTAIAVAVVALVGCSTAEPRHGYTALRAGVGSSARANGSPTVTAGDGRAPDGAGEASAGGQAQGLTPQESGNPGNQPPVTGRQDVRPAEAGARPTVGVTADSIVVSVSMPFSGPLGQIFEDVYKAGPQTWANEVNDNGGIHGRRVVLKKIDNQNTVDGAVAACKQEQSNGSFIALLAVGPDAEADCLDAAGRPGLQIQTAELNPARRHGRAIQQASAMGQRVAEYVRGPLGRADRKIGVIYTDDYSWTPLKVGFLERAEQLKLNVVRVEKVAPNQTSFVSELSRLRAAGADTVAMFSVTETFGILRDAKGIGYAPVWTGGNWLDDNISAAGAELMTGIAGLRTWATSESAAYAKYKQVHAKYGSGTRSTTSMAVYAHSLALGRVLTAAGPNPTHAGLRAAFDSISGFDTGMLPPVSWAGGRIIGVTGAFPVQCCHPDRTWKGLGPAVDHF